MGCGTRKFVNHCSVKQTAGKPVFRYPHYETKPLSLSSEQYRHKACCACSAADLDMRDFLPPVHVQDSLKTTNVKCLEGADVTTVRCLSLAGMRHTAAQMTL